MEKLRLWICLAFLLSCALGRRPAVIPRFDPDCLESVTETIHWCEAKLVSSRSQYKKVFLDFQNQPDLFREELNLHAQQLTLHASECIRIVSNGLGQFHIDLPRLLEWTRVYGDFHRFVRECHPEAEFWIHDRISEHTEKAAVAYQKVIELVRYADHRFPHNAASEFEKACDGLAHLHLALGHVNTAVSVWRTCIDTITLRLFDGGGEGEISQSFSEAISHMSDSKEYWLQLMKDEPVMISDSE